MRAHIIFTAAKQVTQDGVRLIKIGKIYQVHSDAAIGDFFIGERGVHGVIQIDHLPYFRDSEKYGWQYQIIENGVDVGDVNYVAEASHD